MDKQLIKKLIKLLVPEFVIESRRTLRSLKPISKRQCNICGYYGWFKRFGRPPRLDARCPECLSLERHRLMMLAFERNQIPITIEEDDKVLHFAPEKVVEQIFREKYQKYRTADLYAEADLKLDLEHIDLPSDSVKMIIASHVLEHVDDIKASLELSRILSPGGVMICMVPIVEGWEMTYEDPGVNTEQLKWVHFGQGDHVRYYGRDFRRRIENGGLTLVDEITAEGTDVITFGLLRGEKVFVFRKALEN